MPVLSRPQQLLLPKIRVSFVRLLTVLLAYSWSENISDNANRSGRFSRSTRGQGGYIARLTEASEVIDFKAKASSNSKTARKKNTTADIPADTPDNPMAPAQRKAKPQVSHLTYTYTQLRPGAGLTFIFTI